MVECCKTKLLRKKKKGAGSSKQPLSTLSKLSTVLPNKSGYQ